MHKSIVPVNFIYMAGVGVKSNVRCGKERLIPKNVLTKTGTVVNIIENRTHSVVCARTVLAQGGRTVLNAADSECPLYEREEDDEKSGIFTACG